MPERILIIGFQADTPIRHVASVAASLGLAVDYLDLQRYLGGGSLQFTTREPEKARVRVAGERFLLADYAGVYQRLALPPPDETQRGRWPQMRARYVALECALLAYAGRVVNRPLSGWENMSKPLQTYNLALAGFRTPPSLSTSLVEDFREFRAGGETIFKSNSSIRSIVDRVEAVDDERLAYLQYAPVLFQSCISGRDVRVHVVDGATFPVLIESDAIDYRYAHARRKHIDMTPLLALPPQIERLCVSYARSRGLCLAGFDFKLDAAGEWWCLEMNPAPAFEMFDHVLDGAIARRLLGHLLGTPDL